jgi:hypothetical protein
MKGMSFGTGHVSKYFYLASALLNESLLKCRALMTDGLPISFCYLFLHENLTILRGYGLTSKYFAHAKAPIFHTYRSALFRIHYCSGWFSGQ